MKQVCGTMGGMSALSDLVPDGGMGGGGAVTVYSLSFDGVNGYGSASDTGFPTGSGNRTFVAWIKFTSAPGNAFASYGRPGNATGASNQQDFIPIVTTTPNLRISPYGGDVTGSTTLSTNTWYHIAIVISGGSVLLYVNGVAETTSGSITLSTVLNGHYVLGCRWDGDSSQTEFNPIKIAEPAVFGSALSAGTIAGIASGATDPGTLSPLVYHKLTEGTGTTAADSSGNGNTLTLHGGATWSSDKPSVL